MAVMDAQASNERNHPHRFERSHTCTQIREQFADIARGAESTDWVSAAGRVVGVRVHRRTAFFDLEDLTGTIQCHAKVPKNGPGSLPSMGDVVGVIGPVTRTTISS